MRKHQIILELDAVEIKKKKKPYNVSNFLEAASDCHQPKAILGISSIYPTEDTYSACSYHIFLITSNILAQKSVFGRRGRIGS